MPDDVSAGGPRAHPGTPDAVTLTEILGRTRLLRRGCEAAITPVRFDIVLSRILDTVIELEEAVRQALRASLATTAPEPLAPVILGAVAPASLATSCPRCGAPRMCCKGSGTASLGDPADYGANP